VYVQLEGEVATVADLDEGLQDRREVDVALTGP
jgi:hypothetical protein